jgi:hypothetical protein
VPDIIMGPARDHGHLINIFGVAVTIPVNSAIDLADKKNKAHVV